MPAGSHHAGDAAGKGSATSQLTLVSNSKSVQTAPTLLAERTPRSGEKKVKFVQFPEDVVAVPGDAISAVPACLESRGNLIVVIDDC